MTTLSVLLKVVIFTGLLRNVCAIQSSPSPGRNRHEQGLLVPRWSFYPLSTWGWDNDIDRSLRMVDALMEQAWRGAKDFEYFAQEVGNKRMPLEIMEDESGYYLRAEVPGIPKDHLKINLNEDILTISADWSDVQYKTEATSSSSSERGDDDTQDMSESYPRKLRKEGEKSVIEQKDGARDLTTASEKRGTFRSYGQMSRTIKLPSWADLDHITAKHENGVLEIFVPMLEEHHTGKDKGRNIEIDTT